MDWKKRKKRRRLARKARCDHYWEYKEHVKLFATGWLVHVPRKARKARKRLDPPSPETRAAIRKAEFDGMPLSKFSEQARWWEGIQDKELQKYE